MELLNNHSFYGYLTFHSTLHTKIYTVHSCVEVALHRALQWADLILGVCIAFNSSPHTQDVSELGGHILDTYAVDANRKENLCEPVLGRSFGRYKHFKYHNTERTVSCLRV
jgi:hypothetical protein